MGLAPSKWRQPRVDLHGECVKADEPVLLALEDDAVGHQGDPRLHQACSHSPEGINVERTGYTITLKIIDVIILVAALPRMNSKPGYTNNSIPLFCISLIGI